MLELVIALAILGAMVAILFAGLRVGLRAWQRGEDMTQITQHQRSLSQVLEQAMTGIHAYQGFTEEQGPRTLLFQGEPDRVAFVTVAPPVPLARNVAYTAVLLSMQEPEPNLQPGLVIRERILPNLLPFEEAQPVLVDSTTASVRFRYLRDVGGSWEESWDAAAERALPRGIEITVTTLLNGDAVEQPPIVVPIRAVAP
jgi:general secretion pathway protein J